MQAGRITVLLGINAGTVVRFFGGGSVLNPHPLCFYGVLSITSVAKVGSETVLPQTPPSVVKPPGPSDGKIVIGSSVQKAFFHELSPRDGSESVLELAPQVQSEELMMQILHLPHLLRLRQRKI